MLDLFNLPFPGNANVQVFSTIRGPVGVGYHSYVIPRGKSMLFIYASGGGGGGGGGFSGVAGSARGGGGSGGSGAISTLLVPVHLLPSRLFLRVGDGGQGGLVGTSVATNGSVSIVAIEPSDSTAANVLLTANAGTAAADGSGTSGGGNGNGGSATLIASAPLAGLGIFNSLAGQNGVNGGAHTGAAGLNVAFPVTGINVMGGASGAGTTSADFAGGGITAVTSSLISEQRPEAAAAGSNSGSGGHRPSNFFFNYPGLGGGASNTGAGGNGGNGGYGCGGGGGGGGTTGGRGGDGGSGLIIMIAW